MTRPESLNTQLANAMATLANANDHLERMRAAYESARCKETDACNRVNEAQQAFDLLVAEVKKSAPGGSDWRRPVGIPV